MRPEIVIITSNYSIAQCFDGEDIEAMKRRFHEIHTNDIHRLRLNDNGLPYLCNPEEVGPHEYSILDGPSNTI